MARYTLTLVVTFVACAAQSSAADWETVSVPGEQSFTDYAWYRTWLKPHATFFSKHERDLFGESVILNIRGLPGAHELCINGNRIGSGGQFPPEFKDGREGNHRHKIPSGTFVADQWNEVAIRVYNPGGKGGFLTEAPFVMNYFYECVLERPWEFRRGDQAPGGGPLKTKPTTSAFEEFHESNRVLGEADQLFHGEKLPPEESLAKMTAADDLIVELMLAEPLVAQPTHFSFDARGRLWVSQYRQYPYPAGLKMISRDHYYRSHYDRIPPAPPNHDHGRDIISIHEDPTVNLAHALVDSSRSSLEMRVRLGDMAATGDAIALLTNGAAAVDERTAVARTLGEVRVPESLEPLMDVSLTAEDTVSARESRNIVDQRDFTQCGNS